MAEYEEQVAELLGEELYELLQENADSGKNKLKQAKVIAKRLPDEKIFANLSQASEMPNFVFDRTALRKILSDWFVFCGPEDRDEAILVLLKILKHKDMIGKKIQDFVVYKNICYPFLFHQTNVRQ